MEALVIEQRNRRKGKRISFFVHAILLLLAFLYIFPNDPNQNIDTQYAVAVNFANTRSTSSTKSSATKGKQRPVTETPVQIETTPAKKVEPTQTETKPPEIKENKTPEPTEPIQTEILQEESDVVAVEEEIPVEEPEPEIIEEAPPEIIIIEEPEEIKPDATLEDVLKDINEEPESSSGTIDDVEESSAEESGPAPSEIESDDTGTGKADEGTGSGADDAGNDNDSGMVDDGAGTGEFDDSGDGIFGRKVIFRDPSMIRNASAKSGRIVFKVCINRKGTVSYVELNEFESTISDRSMLRNAMRAMWKYKYEPDRSAAAEQCGKFSVIIDNYEGIIGGQ